MKEVSTPTAALLLDALERRGLDPWRVWSGLDVSATTFRDRGQRIDWDVWVEMMARAEVAAGGPASMELLFVPGAGARTGHPFVRLAKSFLTLPNTYELFARWGIPRTLLVAQARFSQDGPSRASFEIDIDTSRRGSLPLLRFIVGILRNMPVLLGLREAEVRLDAASTPHRGRYALVLPHEASMLGRARRVVGLFGGANAALAELEQQSSEISAQNRELREKVSELERTTSSLQQQDAWLELALDAGKLGLWRLDMDSQRMSWSPGAAKIIGVPVPREGEGVGVVWSERIHPDDREEVMRTFQSAVANGRPIALSYRVPQKDGTSRWVAAKGRVHYGLDGRPSHALGTVADVTEHKLIENKLRFADRMISAGTLAAGVAHEINNPLTYVMGTVELLREQASDGAIDPAAMTEALSDLFDGLGRIRDVVADLRSFARPEEEHVEWLPIDKLCRGALRVVTPAVRHRAQVALELDDGGVFVHVNASRLGQVLTNLILNAGQAMPERPVAENLIVVRTRAAAETVTIEIEDNGAGIAPEVLPRLFDPFFTTKAHGVGTGLGLSVCQSIVHAHCGRIEVETELARGTRFRVVLPCVAELAAAEVRREAEVAPVPAAPLSGARILVIDDEPILRKTLSQLLDAEGGVVTAVEGVPAARALALQSFDVFLCDVMMPDGMGEDLLHALEAQDPTLTRRVIFMSGGAVTPRAAEFCATTTQPVLRKPFAIATVLEAIAGISRSPRG